MMNKKFINKFLEFRSTPRICKTLKLANRFSEGSLYDDAINQKQTEPTDREIINP